MGKEVDDCLTLLDAVFSKYNSEDILSTLIELQLFSEMGKPDDKKMQKAEWLAANLLRYNIKDSAHTFSHSNFMSLNTCGKSGLRQGSLRCI
ncbi:MAG: hypothetical protein A2Y23_08765 [Clostridiales bacterium GWB2_37_7]|nr:MAG: hypothetical protein A2Y23_08765 [Clostridiales bacterium GWB2_37_7]